MPTDDGRDIPELNGKPYPSMPHCKGYKWQEGVTYNPYVGRAIPTNYFGHPEYISKAKILHYCMFTKELEEKKKEWVMNEYGIF
jgi:hypothetical protein